MAGADAAPPDAVTLAPVRIDGRLVGVVASSVDRAVDANRVARRIGTVAAALEAVEERGRALLERSRETNLFYLLGEAIGATLDLGRIADLLVAEARRIGNADAAVMLLADPETAELRLRSRDGDARTGDALATQLLDRLPLLDGMSWAGSRLPGEPTPDLGPVLTVGVDAGSLTLGLLALARAPGADDFTARDERVIGALTAGAGIQKARYHDRELRRQRLEQELALGRRIQLSLLPTTLPVPAGWGIHAVYRAAREVGGDFYGAIPRVDDVGDDRLAVVVADVTGKGVPAALFMAHATSVLRRCAHEMEPRAALEEANRLIRADNRSGLLLTALLADVDAGSGRVRLASAGHEPGLHVDRAGRVAEVGGGGVLLGLSAASTIGEADLILANGDSLLLYTDGVTEARRDDGEFFGEKRLRSIVEANASASAAAMADAVVWAVDEFRAGAPAFDDLTLLVIRREA